MAKLGRSFTKTFVPSFQQSYEQGQRYAYLQQQKEEEQAQQNLERASKIQEAEIKQARANEDMRLFRLLGQGGENYPDVTSGGQQFVPLTKDQKVDIISRLNITPNEKFQQLEKLNAPEKEPTFVYKKESPTVFKENPVTKELMPTDLENPLYEVPQKIRFERTQPKYDNKLDKLVMYERKFKGDELVDENMKTFEVKEPKQGGARLTKEAKSILNGFRKSQVELSSDLQAGIRAKAYEKDGDWVVLNSKGEEASVKDIRAFKESQLKENNAKYAETAKAFMSGNAKDLLDQMYNAQSGKKKGKALPSANDYWYNVIEQFKNGELETSDVELLKHHFIATYGREPNAR